LVIPPGRLINVRKNDVDVEDPKNEVKHTVAVARYTKSQTIMLQFTNLINEVAPIVTAMVCK